MTLDYCKRCRAGRPHESRPHPHNPLGPQWWWCVCGAQKHLLSAKAVATRDRELVVAVIA